MRDGDTRHNIDGLAVLRLIDVFGLQSVTMYYGWQTWEIVGAENAGDYSEAANLGLPAILNLYWRLGFGARFVCLCVQPLTYDAEIG